MPTRPSAQRKDAGGEWQGLTLKPVSRCQHPLLALHGVVHEGASEVKEDWSPEDKAGHPSGSALRG